MSRLISAELMLEAEVGAVALRAQQVPPGMHYAYLSACGCRDGTPL